jgi:hypothetical protein
MTLDAMAFTLEMLLNGGQSPPVSISLQGFALQILAERVNT